MISEYHKCPYCGKTKHDAMFTEGFTRHPMCHPCRAATIGLERREKTRDWRKDTTGWAVCGKCGLKTTTEDVCNHCNRTRRKLAVKYKLTVIQGGKNGL